MKDKYSVFSDKKLLPLLVIAFTIAITFNLFSHSDNQFGYLAESFLKGKTYFLDKYLPLDNTSDFMGKAYWPLSPFPAIVLMPFVAIFLVFGLVFYTGYLQLFLVIGVFCLIYKIVLSLKYSKKESVYISTAFCLASPFIAVAFVPASWHFAQAVSVSILFLIIYEYLGKRRYSLMGVMASLLLATRVTASFVVVFPLLSLLFVEKGKLVRKMKTAVWVIVPFFVVAGVLFAYNYTRFGNVFEQGYKLQTISKELEPLRSKGLFSPVHIPGNLYYFLVKTPKLILEPPFLVPSPWGMSILVTSAYFLLMFTLKYKDKLSKIILVTALAIAIPIFSYYGIGFMQYGYRYALDFLPLLFFLLIRNYKLQFGKLPRYFDWFVVILGFFNIYLFFVYQYELGLLMDKLL